MRRPWTAAQHAEIERMTAAAAYVRHIDMNSDGWHRRTRWLYDEDGELLIWFVLREFKVAKAKD
jgi:hypothetical protein